MATNQEVKDFYGLADDEVAAATLTAQREAAEAQVADDEVSATHARYDLLVKLKTGVFLEAAGLFTSRTEEERVADVMQRNVVTGGDGEPLMSLEDVYQKFLNNINGLVDNFSGEPL